MTRIVQVPRTRRPAGVTPERAIPPRDFDNGILLFDGPDLTYVGLVDGRWWRWPAEKHGWRKRQPCSEHDSYGRPQFDERKASLGWRLSGVWNGR